MRKLKENIFIKIFFCTIFIIFGAIINFVVHELSHLLMLWVCGGNVAEFSLFGGMFVGGEIPYNYVSIVSLSSIFIPFILSALFSFVKNKWMILWNMGFIVPTIMNVAFGIYAVFFIKDVATQNTYDLALACNFMENDWVIIVLCIVVLILEFSLIWNGLKRIKEKL